MNPIFNVLAFQTGWWACVAGVGLGYEIPALLLCFALVCTQLFYSCTRTNDIQLGLSAWIMGMVIDSGLQYASVITFYGWALGPLSPFWLWMLWMLFALTLNSSLSKLKELPLVFSALLGLILGPLTYIAGAKLGAAAFDHSLMHIAILAVAWMLAMPALVRVAQRFSIQTNGELP